MNKLLLMHKEVCEHPVFYAVATTFLLFQLVADLCANYAATQSKLLWSIPFVTLIAVFVSVDVEVEAVVRVVFWLL